MDMITGACQKSTWQGDGCAKHPGHCIEWPTLTLCCAAGSVMMVITTQGVIGMEAIAVTRPIISITARRKCDGCSYTTTC